MLLKQSINKTKLTTTGSDCKPSGYNLAEYLAPSDVSRLQLVGQDEHWPGYMKYQSVEHFLYSSENALRTLGNKVEDVWKRYIGTGIPFDYCNWVNGELLGCDSCNKTALDILPLFFFYLFFSVIKSILSTFFISTNILFQSIYLIQCLLILHLPLLLLKLKTS